MAGAVQDVEAQFADRNSFALLEPAVRREIAHAGHAEPRAARHHIIEQELVGDVRADDVNLQRVPQLGGAADMIDMTMGEPDLFDGDAGLLDRCLDFWNVAAWVDHDSFFGGLTPQDRAVLLEQRYGDDDRAGFRLGFGLLCHVRTMPIFCGQPSQRFAHVWPKWRGSATSRSRDPSSASR